MRDDWWPWLLRLLWLVLPFAAGPALGDALADTGRAVQLTATIGLWIVWGAGLVFTLVPHAATLTPMRIVAPGSLAVAAIAALDHGAGGSTIASLAATAAVAAVSLAPQIGAWYVNGSSYGDERRMPLRAPGALLLGPIEAAWAVIVATAVAGPLLLGSRHWIAGALTVAIGGVGSILAARALHRLARRWLVFVPAGVVIHDLLSMAEPVLVKRAAIERFGPALSGTDAADLTMVALGLALELRLSTTVQVALRPQPDATPEAVEVSALMFSVSRPGSVLDEAERRRIKVG